MTNSKISTSTVLGRRGTDAIGRKRSAAHPRFSLKKAEELARVVFDAGPRNLDPDFVAKKVGYSAAKNGSFATLKSTASQFGLIRVDDSGISVQEDWIQALHSGDPEALRRVRREAVIRPDLYKQLIEEYAGKQLPSPEKLERELHLNEKYGVLKDAAGVAAQVFLDSTIYAGILDDNRFLRLDDDATTSGGSPMIGAPKIGQKETTVPVRRAEVFSRDEFSRQTVMGVSDVTGGNTIYESVQVPVGLERYEVLLRNGKRAYMFVPVPLPLNEKDRLKQYIDLMLEDTTKDPPAKVIEHDDNSA